MQKTNYRKLVSHSFDKLHEHLSMLRSHVEVMDGPGSSKVPGIHGIRLARTHAQAPNASGHPV
jgi:hypothetical protein